MNEKQSLRGTDPSSDANVLKSAGRLKQRPLLEGLGAIYLLWDARLGFWQAVFPNCFFGKAVVDRVGQILYNHSTEISQLKQYWSLVSDEDLLKTNYQNDLFLVALYSSLIVMTLSRIRPLQHSTDHHRTRTKDNMRWNALHQTNPSNACLGFWIIQKFPGASPNPTTSQQSHREQLWSDFKVQISKGM